MSFEYDDYDESEDSVDNPHDNSYCEDCKWLTDAVRDLEQQRREAIDQCSRELGSLSKFSEEFGRTEERFLARMRTLDHRRNAALDVLAKHQQLEHQ